MIRRTLILAALALVVASGAMAGEERFKIDPSLVDTADYVGLDDADEVNDTIGPFWSKGFGYSSPFHAVSGSIFITSNADTATATGLSHDSAYTVLQTKFDWPDEDSTWHNVWVGALAPVSAFNTSGGLATFIEIPEDSLTAMGNWYRVGVYWIGETDSIRVEANRNAATADSCCVDWGAVFQGLLNFR